MEAGGENTRRPRLNAEIHRPHARKRRWASMMTLGRYDISQGTRFKHWRGRVAKPRLRQLTDYGSGLHGEKFSRSSTLMGPGYRYEPFGGAWAAPAGTIFRSRALDTNIKTAVAGVNITTPLRVTAAAVVGRSLGLYTTARTTLKRPARRL